MDSIVRTTTKESNMTSNQNRVVIENREKLTMTGVAKVDSASDTTISLHVGKMAVIIQGVGLLVNKFDVDSGALEIVGQINALKYNASKTKGFFRRLVK